MKKFSTLKMAVAALAATAATSIFAHDGHGLTGAHWHTSDAWGFAVAGLAALGIWLTRGGK